MMRQVVPLGIAAAVLILGGCSRKPTPNDLKGLSPAERKALHDEIHALAAGEEEPVTMAGGSMNIKTNTPCSWEGRKASRAHTLKNYELRSITLNGAASVRRTNGTAWRIRAEYSSGGYVVFTTGSSGKDLKMDSDIDFTIDPDQSWSHPDDVGYISKITFETGGNWNALPSPCLSTGVCEFTKLNQPVLKLNLCKNSTSTGPCE